MNQVTHPGTNSNPSMPDRPKSSVANIIGICGFAVFSIAYIVYFILNIYICSIYQSASYEEIQSLTKICDNIYYALPPSYLAICIFFVMDMMKRKGIKKIIDIIGLIAIILIIIANFSHLVMNFESREEYWEFDKIRNYIFLSGYILLALFFAGFLRNAKLIIPSLCTVVLIIIYRGLYFYIQDINYYLLACTGILTYCSMLWFMYKYMRIGGSDIQFRRSYGTVSHVAHVNHVNPKSVLIRSIATAVCICLGLAIEFMPWMAVKFMGFHDASFYDLFPLDWEFLMKSDTEGASFFRLYLFTFIPAILLFAASIKSRNIICPIIATLLSLVTLVMAIIIVDDINTGRYLTFGGGFAFIVLLYVALIGLTIAIIVQSRKQPKPQTENQSSIKSGKSTTNHII